MATDAEIEAEDAEVRDTLSIEPGVDPLQALLNLDKRAEDVREPVSVTLVDGTRTTWIVRALTDPEITEANERSTRWVKHGRGPRVQDLDTSRFAILLISAAVVTPDLKDQRVLAKFISSDAEGVVAKALLPGVRDALSEKVLEISGYSDDLVSVGKS